MLERVIKLNHVRTRSQLAYLLTKALGHKQFFELLSKMGLNNIYQPKVHLEGEYQDQGRIAEQLEQRKQDSTNVVEVQEAISDALVV